MKKAYISSSPISEEKDVCIANCMIKKERRGFLCDHYVMVLITKGRGTYIEEDTGKTHIIEQGDIMQRVPGKSHAQLFDTDDNEQYFIKVPKEIYFLMLERGQINTQRILKMKRGDAFAQYDRCLKDCAAKNDPAHALWRVKDLIADLHAMSRDISSEYDRIEEAKRYLTMHLTDRVSLPDLAAKLNMSYINFRRLFKKETGRSPGSWLIQQRVERACQLLRNDTFSMKEISEFLGYPDVYTFSKQFKKEMGIPPSELRGRD